MAGSLAGTTGQALTYPLDRARAVMAVTKVGEFRNIFHVFSTIYHREGILGKQFEINLIYHTGHSEVISSKRLLGVYKDQQISKIMLYSGFMRFSYFIDQFSKK